MKALIRHTAIKLILSWLVALLLVVSPAINFSPNSGLVVKAQAGGPGPGENFPLGGDDSFPGPEAKAWYLLDVGTGQTLAANNAQRSLPMASTTKIMTALLLLEKADLGEMLWVPYEARGIAGSKLYLEPGERYTAEDLLLALMIASANDAAIAIALNLAETLPDFADLMNQRAAQLGLEQTNFVNPHGLHAAEHYSSAADLAYLAAAAMENEEFRRLAGLTNGVINDPIRASSRELNSHNLFLVRYPHATGIKTGFTSQAGFCLVAAAEKDGRQLIGVILGGDDGRRVARDMEAMMDWGFEAFETVQVLAAGSPVETGAAGEEKSRWQTAAAVEALRPVGSETEPTVTTQVVRRTGTSGTAAARTITGDSSAAGELVLDVRGAGGLQVQVPLQPAGGPLGLGGIKDVRSRPNSLANTLVGRWWPLWLPLAAGFATVLWRRRRQNRRLQGWRRLQRQGRRPQYRRSRPSQVSRRGQG